MDPTGKFLYMAGGVSNGNYSVFALTINANNGALTAVPGSPFITDPNSSAAVAVDPTGKFLYVEVVGRLRGRVANQDILPTGREVGCSGEDQSGWPQFGQQRAIGREDGQHNRNRLRRVGSYRPDLDLAVIIARRKTGRIDEHANVGHVRERLCQRAAASGRSIASQPGLPDRLVAVAV